MTPNEMTKIMKAKPQSVAVFKIVKIDKWYFEGFVEDLEPVKIGDEVIKWNNGEYVRLSDGSNVCFITPDWLEFVRYDLLQVNK